MAVARRGFQRTRWLKLQAFRYVVFALAAVFFLISLNSESFLDALEPHRRAFLLATPESVAVDDGALDALAQDAEDEDDDEDDD